MPALAVRPSLGTHAHIRHPNSSPCTLCGGHGRRGDAPGNRVGTVPLTPELAVVLVIFKGTGDLIHPPSRVFLTLIF